MTYRPSLWHMSYRPSLWNAVPNIPELSLQIGDFVTVSEAFKDYYAVATGLSYEDKIEINNFKKRDHHYALCENDLDSHPIRNLQKIDGKMMNSSDHYSFNWDKSGSSMPVYTCIFIYFIRISSLISLTSFLDYLKEASTKYSMITIVF